MSAILSSLKLVNAKRQNSVDPVVFRRNKLNEKLKVQIAMAEALNKGESFNVKRKKLMRDELTGTTSYVDINKRVKTWWFTNTETKLIAVKLFYGNRGIDLAKGKNAVEVANWDQLISVLTRLQQAVLDGSLDVQIEQAADSVKARFAK
jgi:hypothetical protein